jgi:lipopolysaccharide export system permease protein
MKSAGISLTRIMIPTLLITLIVSILSFLSSNYFIPVSNLKFKTRLLDIKKQKPMLNLEVGVFNDDFAGYTIKIGNKGGDGRSIYDVLIYDHVNTPLGKLAVIRADSGEMYLSADGQYLVMKLYNGHQYREMRDEPDKYRPFIRSSFDSWQKLFDLKEFELKRSDESLYKEHYSMLSVRQLSNAIDTFQTELNDLRTFVLKDFKPEARLAKNAYIHPRDSSRVKKTANYTSPGKAITTELPKDKMWPEQRSLDDPSNFNSLVETFVGDDSAMIVDRADKLIDARFSAFRRNLVQEENTRVILAKHKYEMHTKFSFAVICMVFLFVGGPMGAIIRKGGYGYPLLVTIILFIIFMVLTMACRDSMKILKMDAVIAAWLPTAVFFPVSIYLTVKAMNDSKFMDVGRLFRNFTLFLQKIGAGRITADNTSLDS